MSEQAGGVVDSACATGSATAGTSTPSDPFWRVIANPVAGRAGRNARAWRDLERALRYTGIHFDVQWTGAAGDGARIAAAAWREGHQHFLVAGGDGSLHDVVNGLMRERTDMGDQASTGVPTVVPLPLGTGNDWARSLGLPRQAAALAAMILRNATVLHDVGRVDLLDAAGARCDTRWFVNVAGAGFDAHVIERMPARTPSRFAYLWGALRELAKYRAPAFRLMLDDGPLPLTGRLLLAFVANGQYCGNNMHVAPTARQDDGVFDVVAIRDVGLWRALPKLARLYSGGLLRDPLVLHRRASRVYIAADPAAGVEADGQFVGHTPAVITMQSKALRTLRAVVTDD